MLKIFAKWMGIGHVFMLCAACAPIYVPTQQAEGVASLTLPVESKSFFREISMNSSTLLFGFLDEEGCTTSLYKPPKPKDSYSQSSTFPIPGDSAVLISLFSQAGAYRCELNTAFTAQRNQDYAVELSKDWRGCQISVFQLVDNNDHTAVPLSAVSGNGREGFCVEESQ